MPDIAAKLVKHFRTYDVNERCGFITKRGAVVEVPNTHPHPSTGFRICPKRIIEAIKKGHIATWHTHPNTDPNLSGEDYECFITWDSMVHYIVGVRDGLITVTRFAVEDGVVIQK